MSPVMVGRARPFARLAGIVDAADVMTSDQPAVALVSGEAGIGKTRLVRELVASLPSSVNTIAVTAQPGSMGRPLDAVTGLVDSSLKGDDVVGAVFDLVATAVAKGPALLVIEDLHWIDTTSANLVDRLAQQPWPNLVIVATYRPDELSRGQPGGELVLRLERRHSVEQVRLDRLDRSEVGAMVSAIAATAEAQPSSAFVEALHRRTAGVPFVVEELMRVVGQRALVSEVLDAELPWSLEEAVRQQLDGLDDPRRRVVEALAVYGRAASFEALLGVTEADESDLIAALRSLTSTGVVVEVSDDKFWFSHALVADAIVHQLLGRERRRLHERCFEVIRALMLDHASLAYHARGAERHDEIPAIARRGAARYLEKGLTFAALRLADEGLSEAPNDPELLAVATEAAWRLDFVDEALTTGLRWVKVAVEPAERIDALRFVARLHHERSDEPAALARIADLELLRATLDDRRLRGVAAWSLAQLHMIAGRDVDATAWADEALLDARAVGDQLTEARALVERAGACVPKLARADALEVFRVAVDAARRSGDAVLLTRVINNGLDLVPSHSAEAIELRLEMQEVSSRIGFDKLGTAATLAWELQAAYSAGDLPVLRRVAAEGSQWWRRQGTHQMWDSSLHVGMALEEGRLEDAAVAYEHFIAGCPTTKHQYYQRLKIGLAAASRDRAAGPALFEDVLLLPQPYDTAEVLNTTLIMIEDLLMLGISPADIRARLLDEWLGDHPSAAAMRAHADGLLAMAEADPVAAVPALRAVLADPDPRLAKPIIGTMRTALAEALLATGDRGDALLAIRRAIEDDFARWPGVRRDRAEALARRLQGSSARSDGELTPREREVAALVAAGLTNGQLADRLFISPKTAAVHVSNILAKLGLSTRAEIAAWAVRHDLSA
jgi:DNA-binding NarL/FixJ family response regulator/type II secretory pathway predicted ATPase ExeA